MKLLVLLFCFLLVSPEGRCQTELDRQIQIIKHLQVDKDPFYDAGLFRSKRYWFSEDRFSDDNNVFVTASIVYILNSLDNYLNAGQKQIVKQITDRATANYWKYTNRNGEATYNFWQTTPPDLPFPNGSSFLMKKKYRLPDDYDDTSLVCLSSKPDTARDRAVRSKMIEYSLRNNRKTVKNTPNDYQHFNAFEVFYVDKMDQEYDLVVMCNTLQFALERGFELTETDHETIRFIEYAVRHNDHINRPVALSPSYMTTAMILYHLARLMAIDEHGLLEGIEEKLINDLQTLLTQDEERGFTSLLACNALLRLGQTPSFAIDLAAIEQHVQDFVFFQFKPRSVLSIDIIPAMKWCSEAYNRVLLLEYLALTQKNHP